MISAFLTGISVLILPIGLVAPKGIAVLFILAAIGALAGLWRDRQLGTGTSPVEYALAVFALVALLSAAWSTSPVRSLQSAVLLVLTIIGAVVLMRAASAISATGRLRLERVLFYGIGVAFIWLAFDLLSGGILAAAVRYLKGAAINPSDDPRMFLTNGTSIAAVLVWPWLIALVRRTGIGVACLALPGFIVVLLFGTADTTPCAIIVGAVAAAAAFFRPQGTRRIAIILVTLATFGAPFVAKALPDPSEDGPYISWLSNSVLHRVLIWRNTETLIEARPYFGHGFDTARTFYGPDQKQESVLSGRIKITSEPIPSHPHNAILQVWLELGAVGITILAAFLVLILRGIRKFDADPLSRAAVMGAFVTAFVIANMSYGAWQSWWLGGLAMSAALLRAISSMSDSRKRCVDANGSRPI